ncbi:MAG: CapA family protein, partial [Ilumatobacter sp.]
IHVGKELLPGPDPTDRTLVQRLTAMADVDAVFVHGPHVVQPFEIVNDTPVWWSLGNFVSEMGPPSVGRYADARTADGLLAFVDFSERGDGGFDAVTRSIAICNDLADRTVRVASVSLADPDLPARVRTELTGCRERTRLVVPDVS